MVVGTVWPLQLQVFIAWPTLGVGLSQVGRRVATIRTDRPLTRELMARLPSSPIKEEVLCLLQWSSHQQLLTQPLLSLYFSHILKNNPLSPRKIQSPRDSLSSTLASSIEENLWCFIPLRDIGFVPKHKIKQRYLDLIRHILTLLVSLIKHTHSRLLFCFAYLACH